MVIINSTGDGNSKIIVKPDLNLTPDSRGLGYVFYESMCLHQNKIAQIDVASGKKQTYSQTLQMSLRAAIEMKARGVTSDHVICLCSCNRSEAFVVFYATQFLGAKIASLDPTLSSSDVAHLLKQVIPKMLFVEKSSSKLIEDSLVGTDLDPEIVMFDHSSFEEFLQESPEESSFRPVEVGNAMETAMIVFSSGTTGLAKGICLNHYSILSQCMVVLDDAKFAEVFLLFTSLYWISSIMMFCIRTIIGRTQIVINTFDLDLFWNIISKYKVNFCFMSPYFALSLRKTGRPKSADTTSLLYLLIGGGAATPNQLTEIKKLFPSTIIRMGYGLTETTGTAINFRELDPVDVALAEKYPDSCGTPKNGFSYKIVDLNTEEALGPNEEGELRIKTKMAMNGYRNLDSREAWDSHGWLKTGDIAYYNEDKCFFILDRIKDVIKFRSWHVLPAFLESVLLTHPSVKAAMVIGIPHKTDGEHPMGLVVLHESHNETHAQDLKKYIEERVSDRQHLRAGVTIVSNIPTTSSGKLKRRETRNEIITKQL